jgi:xanthine dehydrogenase YagR molybdenum-binding subunit
MSADRGPASGQTTKPVALAPESWESGQADPVAAPENGHVGAPVSRLDGVAKVTGAARFAAEVPMNDLLYAALAYSTVAKGRITELDTGDAESAPGVVLVMTHRNAPRLNPGKVTGTAPRAAATDDLPIMQDDRIHWNGQPIAVVLAETQEQANHASSLIRATYEVEPATISFAIAKCHTREPEPLRGESLRYEIGDAEAALAAAPHNVDLVYRTPRHNHNAIELHAATVTWEGDELFVHDSLQKVVPVAWTLADIFGLPEEHVHVNSRYVGGGFGGKSLWRHQILAAAASKLAGRPVRIMLSRAGVYRVVGGRTVTEQRVAIGATAQGHFEALIHTGTVAMTPHYKVPPEPVTMPTECLYAADNLRLDVRVADMDTVANTFMRAPGESVGSFALESAIDELADQIGIDPIELRIRNEPDRDPLSGQPFSLRNLVEAYRRGAERFGWAERDPRPRARREGDWLIGIGCATATFPYFRFPGGAARLTLSKDGQATVEVPAHEMGMGTATVHTQIVADRLGLPLADVTFAYGDSSYPGSVLAVGSQQTAMVGAAVSAAHRALVTELLELVGSDSPLAGLTPDEVGGARAGLCKVDDPARYESYASILARSGQGKLSVEASGPPPLELTRWSMHSYGAQFCEVRVNALTGETRVTRYLGSFDCGRILNAKTAASQFRGGIIMGLGMALMEETHLDERTGRIMNASLAEYHLPVHGDVPEIEVIWTDIPDLHTPMGAHGIGEIGIVGVAAAVANAIYNATGTRVRELPITLDKLMSGVGDPGHATMNGVPAAS